VCDAFPPFVLCYSSPLFFLFLSTISYKNTNMDWSIPSLFPPFFLLWCFSLPPNRYSFVLMPRFFWLPFPNILEPCFVISLSPPPLFDPPLVRSLFLLSLPTFHPPYVCWLLRKCGSFIPFPPRFSSLSNFPQLHFYSMVLTLELGHRCPQKPYSPLPSSCCFFWPSPKAP